ncbi:MAG: hypothetical protein VYB54_02955 [Pseudomonadota bacterium]|nr:hypothetical protein [Pseudomonadota bacterium]
MMVIDRDALLAALESLGDSDDATALAAARTAARLVQAADADWDSLLVAMKRKAPSSATPALEDADDQTILRVIDEILARPNLHEGTREDLDAYREELAAGELDPEDRRYILGLHARLN